MESPISIIKSVRKAKKISQAEMARRLDVNLKTYQRLENGKNKRRDLLKDVCKELGLVVLIVDQKQVL